MFRTRSLFFAYNKHTSFHFPDIDLEAGENILVLGESGIGKTTYLHLMAGIFKPKSGSAELMGKTYHELKSSQLDRFRGQYIGLIFQKPHFIHALSLEENLTLVQSLAHKKTDKNRIHQVLDDLGIIHHKSKKTYLLSQGEQQRAAIAMAVVNQPKLLLADEPTSSLDDKNCLKVANLLKEQAASTGAHLIIITHDQRLKSQFQNTIELQQLQKPVLN